MDGLPDELVIHIMTFLPLSTRKVTRLVSKKWFELSYTTRLIKYDVIVVRTIEDLDIFNSDAKHFNVRVRNVGTSSTKSKFWERYGSDIKSIELHQIADLDNPILLHAIKQCSKVKHISLGIPYRSKINEEELTIENDEEHSMDVISLPSLQSLEFKFFSQLVGGVRVRNSHENLINGLLANAKQLRRFSYNLKGYEDDWNKIISVVSNNSTSLKELNFSHAEMEGNNFEAIIAAMGPQLERLFLRESPFISNVALKQIAKKFVNLKELDLFLQDSIFNASASRILENSKNLRKLSLAGSFIGNESFIAIKNLSNLTAIDLSSCSNMSATNLLVAFGSEERPKIRDLRLDAVHWIDDEILCAICPNLPNLLHLSLRNCYKIANAGFQTICEHNKKLRYLFLENCRNITSLGVESPCINDIKGLVHLGLNRCEKIPPSSLRALRLFDLQNIDLFQVPFTSVEIGHLIENCPQLYNIFNGRFHKMLEDMLKEVNKSYWRKFCTTPNYAKESQPSTIFDSPVKLLG